MAESRRAKVTVQFFYFGATCFYRTSLDMSSTIPAMIALHSNYLVNKLTVMKSVIADDMQLAKDAKLGCTPRKTIDWKPNGTFQQLQGHDEFVYIYCHNIHTALSSVQFSQVNQCLTFTTETQKELSRCREHNNHDFLAPFMMDNVALKTYYETQIGETDNVHRKDEATRALGVLSSGQTQDTPYVSPAVDANNWTENDWTLRLYHCIKRKYGCTVHYTASGINFTHVVQILRCEKAMISVFLHQGTPDMIFQQNRVFLNGADGDNDGHQKNPLKGNHGEGPPEKLGELVSAVHVLLVAKYLRVILKKRKLEQKASAKGLLMDKQMGNIHVTLDTDHEFETDKVIKLQGHLLKDFKQLSKKSTCYHLQKLIKRPSPPSEGDNLLV